MWPRRSLLASLPAAALAQSLPNQRGLKRKIAEHDPANTKLSHRMPIKNMTDEDLLFLQQLGLRWARIEFGSDAPFEFMRDTQARLRRFGMEIYSGVDYTYRELDLQLGRPNRDQWIEKFCRFVRDCGRLGIPVANIDWHPANTYTTSIVESPRKYKAREFSVDDFRNKVEKQAFDREYSADDIWATYTYFMKAVLPVAEKAGVRLALHPDDPPLAKMNGVAKLFVNYEGYAARREDRRRIEGLRPHLLRRHLDGRRRRHGQGCLPNDRGLRRPRQDRRRPLPQRQLPAAPLRRNLHRRRLRRHVRGDEDPAQR
ncbi:MAG: mannonate dehydratase [Bryobacterales bacterium]|nr:mannonate dehydratase [Bryobacterales bacterium]